ncbi:MAG TPA: inositol monophosphatase family protein [Saprospiraceae bacterium]|nr:inositol monophosphatase family protein [Saprospiraceae bacterium]
MDFALLLDSILKVTDEAAEFIRSQAGKVTAENIEIKSRNSLVSYVDKQAEKILVEGLGKIIPDSGFITEEGTVDQKTSEYTWVIDPLDGTTNFLQQIPVYSVSVGLLHDEQLVLGVVCDVEHRETFYAWRGGGAWCNGQRIYVSQRTEVSDAVVATGFPYSSKDVLPQLTLIFDYFLKNARGIRRLGSAAIDLAYVACGRFDAYYETSLNPWDIAGGIIIVEEAGGVVTDFGGEMDMMQNGHLIAAPPLLHKTVSKNISTYFNT